MKTNLYGIEAMRQRLRVQGGEPQQDRMIHDKEWSMQHALLYSYQGAKIRNLDSTEEVRALINPDKVKQNYDDKILSVEWKYGFKPGDIFEWLNTKTKWIITLPELTELAYFRSEIRKCNYTISWIDEETGETFTTYAAVRGPVETAIDYIQKNGISVDRPNHSLEILMPKNKHTLEYFKRYSKFYLGGLDEGDQDVCWRVEAKDSISMQGVLQLIADEYYANEFEDDKENHLAGALIVRPATEEEDYNDLISGPSLIKPMVTYEYNFKGKNEMEWEWDKKLPVDIHCEGRKLYLKWLKPQGKKIILKCGSITKEIVIDSLF